MSSDSINEKDNTPVKTDAEEQQLVEKVKYPRAIPFIISNEFCERFNYYGIRTILVLYLTQKLDFTQDSATILYHGFTTFVYFCCIFGAIIADSWWGKFRTILWLSMVYVAGTAVLAVSAVETWNLPMTALTFVGLGLIAVGSGGIKPCVAAFGGEQFKLPQQLKQVGIFFSIFYFAINLGSFISTWVTPILRTQKCFGEEDCFSLGFGVPSALMAVSIVIFLSGKFLYKLNPPSGNMLVKVASCITTAISTKSKQKNTNPKEHWLDYAEEKFGRKLVNETKVLLNVLVLYLPLPGSRWTFQATRMTGDLGFYTIKPDQMQVVNPLLILVFIPLYEVVFYPLLNLIGVRRPLQKLTLGGIFAGFAFLASMFVEMAVEPTYAKLPQPNQAQVRVYNGLNCKYIMDSPVFNMKVDLEPNSYKETLDKSIKEKQENFKFLFTSNDAGCSTFDMSFDIEENSATSLFITGTSAIPSIEKFMDDPEKSDKGNAIVRMLINLKDNVEIKLKSSDNEINLMTNEISVENRTEVTPGKYEITIGSTKIKTDEELLIGGVYVFIIQAGVGSSQYSMNIVKITEENSVPMLWLIPQYVIMTLGEVMYSVTGLQFSYEQAPESMRSVLQGCWQLTVAVGNLIVIFIVGAKFFDSQIYEFALFAVLMFIDMGIFMWLAIRYKPLKLDDGEEPKKEIQQNSEDEISQL